MPEGAAAPLKSILELPELSMYYSKFGRQDGDFAFAAEIEGQVNGIAWTRVIPDYAHIDNDTPSLSIALLP